MKPNNALDPYIQRLQNLDDFNIFTVTPAGAIEPWYPVTGKIVEDLVIRDSDLATQIETVSMQIAHWGRLAAQANRVWQVAERQFRVWKASQYLGAVEQAEKDGAKKPSDKLIEAGYRVADAYASLSQSVERAEEAYSAADAILSAFRAKAQVLRYSVAPAVDAGQQPMMRVPG